MMQLPTSVPEADSSSLWSLQNILLNWAEELVGMRDQSKKIYQPQFHENGPNIRNTPSFDGAFSELSYASKNYWPTVVYEMAHETIHLLNPMAGYTNWLEEGVAVEFSIYAQQQFNLTSIQSPHSGPYHEALNMVRLLPSGTFCAARHVRDAVGSLGSVTFEQLCDLFPNHDLKDLHKLSEQCIPR
ncbi:hypothetical protein [Methylobacillus flagellatus]|nr:hypothetical protein [Methylobacillus flagellatus]